METLKTRLLAFIENRGITKAEFERISGLSNGFVDKAGDNTRRKSLDIISKAFPDLNVTWLLTGEGAMLKPQPPKSGAYTAHDIYNSTVTQGSGLVTDKDIEIAKLRAQIEEKDKMIELLRSLLNLPKL